MKNDYKSLLEIIKSVAKHPAMYATTPEAVHGLMIGITVVALSEKTHQSLEICFKQVQKLVKRVTADLSHSQVQTPLLCDESTFPKHVTSFEAFTKNAELFIELLENDMSKISDNI